MGYRRKSEKELFWKRWQQVNAELFIATGVDLYRFEDEASWWDYLEHSMTIPKSSAQADALRQLVLAWPGGSDTLLGSVLGLRKQE